MNATEILRVVTLAVAATNASFWIAVMIKRPGIRKLASAVLTWSVHVLAFNLVVVLDFAPTRVLNLWSTSIRIHALIVLLAGAILILEDNTWTGPRS